MMNLTDLREELAEQAAEMEHRDLLLGARRSARRTRAVRTTTAATAIAVAAVGSALAGPNLLPSRDTASFDVPVAAAPATEPRRIPIRGIIRDGRQVELSTGVVFRLQGGNYRLTIAQPCDGCSTPQVHTSPVPPRNGSMLGLFGWRPNNRLHAVDFVAGDAKRVVYTVHLPGQPIATYEADTYRLPTVRGWTLAYVEFPANGHVTTVANENRAFAQFRAYDASGKVLRQKYPR